MALGTSIMKHSETLHIAEPITASHTTELSTALVRGPGGGGALTPHGEQNHLDRRSSFPILPSSWIAAVKIKLKFNIRDIGINGREVIRRLDYRCVQSMLAPVGVELTSEEAETQFELTLSPIENAIFVHGTIQASFTVSCGRCLGPAPVRLEEHDLHVTFLPAPSNAEADREIDDVNTFTHDGETLDLEPFVRELLVMSIPMAPLCDPECKGICTSCGRNLNHEACTCDDQNLNLTPWATAIHRLKKQHS